MHTRRQAQAFVRARASDGLLVAKRGVTSTTFSKAVYFSKYPRKLLSLTVDTNLQLEAKKTLFFLQPDYKGGDTISWLCDTQK